MSCYFPNKKRAAKHINRKLYKHLQWAYYLVGRRGGGPTLLTACASPGSSLSWLQATQIVYIPRQLILCSSSYTMSPWREEDMPGQYVSLESVAEAAFRFHCTHNHVESLQHRTPIRDYIKKWLKQLQIM